MSRPSTPALPGSAGAPWRYVLAGFAASLASIGLARFAYAPLVPALIQAHWFSSSSVVFLSAANLTGYLVGALIGQPLARRFSNTQVLRAMMALVTLAFLACAYRQALGWFFGWRLMSGIAGGAIMVLAAATVLPHVPRERRGLAGGAIFLGIGVGIAGSGTVVPWLLGFGLQAAWLGLAAISAVLTLLTWSAWPAHGVTVPVSPAAPSPSALASVSAGVGTSGVGTRGAGTTDVGTTGAGTSGAGTSGRGTSRDSSAPASAPTNASDPRAGVVLLFGQYGLMAVALVAPMVFLVDFVQRGLTGDPHAGAYYWILYGVGAMMGPPLYGWLGDRLGPRSALRLVLAMQAVAMAALTLAHGGGLLAAAAFMVGTFPPGIVPLALARIHDLIPHDPVAQNRAWSRATVSFATFQAVAGYAYSAVFSATGGQHRMLFAVGAVALVVALLAELRPIERALGRRLGAASNQGIADKSSPGSGAGVAGAAVAVPAGGAAGPLLCGAGGGFAGELAGGLAEGFAEGRSDGPAVDFSCRLAHTKASLLPSGSRQ
ncbi:MAG: YbfB/YjiJ family MFS transporter [Achromobacter sp.]|uniref:YbfB/YjiJ family MFS transporter n=1 Tax=Achromobacter sp. TaxID=134375 RepID=UPI0029A3A36E|nr:YbfB/YjiJ family MFS transporter [Achromobacter sp.]MDX3986035.1 YbfB/YjiJ family MFS transporter [Achromobacter sp.]